MDQFSEKEKDKTKLPPRFRAYIDQTDKNLVAARRGISIFESNDFKQAVRSDSLPIFETKEIRSELAHFLDLSVANC